MLNFDQLKTLLIAAQYGDVSDSKSGKAVFKFPLNSNLEDYKLHKVGKHESCTALDENLDALRELIFVRKPILMSVRFDENNWHPAKTLDYSDDLVIDHDYTFVRYRKIEQSVAAQLLDNVVIPKQGELCLVVTSDLSFTANFVESDECGVLYFEYKCGGVDLKYSVHLAYVKAVLAYDEIYRLTKLDRFIREGIYGKF